MINKLFAGMDLWAFFHGIFANHYFCFNPYSAINAAAIISMYAMCNNSCDMQIDSCTLCTTFVVFAGFLKLLPIGGASIYT